MKYRRGEQHKKLSAFHEALVQALKTDSHRPRHERHTARALHAQIKAQGEAGGNTRVTDFIREWRRGEGQSVATTAFVPLAFELGEPFQFDWSEEGRVVGGIYYRMQVSHLKLCAIRAFWLVAYFSEEDVWMRDSGFPARNCHIEEHAAVLRSADEVLPLVKSGNLAIGRAFVRELDSWFPGHAGYLDSALAAWICKCRFGGKPIVLQKRQEAKLELPQEGAVG